MADLELKVGDAFSLPTGLYTFKQEKLNNVLLFEHEHTGRELRVPEWRLKDWLGKGSATKINFVKAEDPAVRGAGDNGEFGPGEDFIESEDGELVRTPELQRARALQFYTIKFDETGRVSRGEKGLQRLIDTWRPIAIQKGIEPKAGEEGFLVKPARLKHCIDHCGCHGERPLRVFRSRRGKAHRKRFHPFVEEALDEGVNFYWAQRERTYQAAYDFFRGKVEAERKRRKKEGLDDLKFPKRPETLRRRIDKAMNHVNWMRKYSKHEAHQKFKGTKNHLYAEAPLDLVIMDHTKIDAWTVLDTETFLPLGRPYLTVAIDVCTRMPLGYLISFEPASLYSVLTCLKRVNKNKAYVSKLYPDIKHKWDGWGRPRQLLVDHGWEFVSPSFQDAMHDLGTDIIWAPVRTPQYKAIGERFFQTLNMQLFHRVKGGVPYDPKRMRLARLNPRKEAMITLADLDELMHQLIVDGYQRRPHDGLQQDIPARLWREKLMFHKRPWIRDINALNSLLGRTASVTLSTSGIRFKNMVFHEPAVVDRLMHDLLKFEKKRSQSPYVHGAGRVKVKVKWNPIDASSIEVWNYGAEPPAYVTIRNRDWRFIRKPVSGSNEEDDADCVKGISFWHVKQIRDYTIACGLKFETEEDRCKARDALRAKWEKLAGLLPLRESKEARRGLAQSQGTFDDKDVNENSDINVDDVLNEEAVSSPDGMEEATLAPDIIAGSERVDHERPVGRRPSERSKRKARRTRERNRKEAVTVESASPDFAHSVGRARSDRKSGKSKTKSASVRTGSGFGEYFE